jgi:two-component system alkaline phosphatase synthesis response regulator PhoP
MNYKINNEEKSIEYYGEKQFLPKKEYLLFVYFQNNPNKVITRETLLKEIWDEGVVVTLRTIDVHIRRLRKRFPDVPIITRKCYGYMWKCTL